MGTRRVVVGKVGAQQSAEMGLVQNEEVIQALAANGANDPLDTRTPVDISNPAIRGQAKTGHRASAQAVRVFYRIAT